MAKIKPTVPGETLFGKVNGQSVQLTRDGSVIKNIGYPHLTATPKQSIQRQKFASLTNRYQFLSSANKSKWLTTSSNYTWIDSAGNVRTRNAVQTYNFCNQNLLLLDLPILEDPKPYADIIQAGITKEPSPGSKFIIKGANTKVEQNYLVYAMVHNSLGAISLQQRPLLVSNLTYDNLGSGVDIGPALKNTFPEVNFTVNVTVKVIAVNNINGNRDLVGETVYGTFSFSGLGLNILSYYPFNGNANDYFNNNNAVYTGTTFDNNGLINGQAIFNGSNTSYINLGNNASLDFEVGGVVQPFSVCLWVYATQTSLDFLFGKRGLGTNGTPASYQMVKRTSDLRAQSFGNSISEYYRTISSASFPLNQWVYVAFTYNADGTVTVYMNGVISSINSTSGGYTLMTAANVDMFIGRYQSNTSYNLVGQICELTFFYQALNSTEFNTIMNANLNGQTILDIN